MKGCAPRTFKHLPDCFVLTQQVGLEYASKLRRASRFCKPRKWLVKNHANHHKVLITALTGEGTVSSAWQDTSDESFPLATLKGLFSYERDYVLCPSDVTLRFLHISTHRGWPVGMWPGLLPSQHTLCVRTMGWRRTAAALPSTLPPRLGTRDGLFP